MDLNLEDRKKRILENNEKYRKEHSFKNKQKIYYKRNKQKYQQYYQNNKEELKEYQKKYYQNNREIILEKQKKKNIPID